jgi:hypothetical protein|tara:strand:+ start:2910 stop:3062 length:153 start_codon:yes stop_codon:yes gene_type:complete
MTRDLAAGVSMDKLVIGGALAGFAAYRATASSSYTNFMCCRHFMGRVLVL